MLNLDTTCAMPVFMILLLEDASYMKMHSFPSFLVTFIFLWEKEENAVVADTSSKWKREEARSRIGLARALLLLLIPS